MGIRWTSGKDVETVSETKVIATDCVSFARWLPRAKRLDFVELNIREADYKLLRTYGVIFNGLSEHIQFKYLSILFDGGFLLTCLLPCCSDTVPVQWDRDVNTSLLTVDTTQTPPQNGWVPSVSERVFGRSSSLIHITSPDGRHEMIANSTLQDWNIFPAVQRAFGLADMFTYNTSCHFHFCGEWYSGWKLVDREAVIQLLAYEIDKCTKIQPFELIALIATYVGALFQSHKEFMRNAPPEWFLSSDDFLFS